MSVNPGERALADLSMDQWNNYKTRFKPLEKRYATDQMSASREAKDKVVLGSMANVQKSAGEGFSTLMANGAGAGINPNSGKMLGLTSKFGAGMASAAGSGAAGANDAVSGQKWAGTAKAMRMGRGQASSSIAGLTASEQLRAQSEALRERTNASIQSSNYSMYGNLAGMAAGAGMYYGGNRTPKEPITMSV